MFFFSVYKIKRKEGNKNMEKEKILAEIICKEMIERKLTLKDLMLAFKIVINKFYNDAKINY